MNVSIVTYKTSIIQLKRAVRCIMADGACVNKIYIIDNSPTREIGEIHFPGSKVEYVFNGQNLGYGSAHNIAIRQSTSGEVNYHLVMNADVYFEIGTLEKLLAFMGANADVGVVMPKVLYPNGDIQYLCKLLPTPLDLFGRRFIPFEKLVNRIDERYTLRFANHDRLLKAPVLSGCFMLLRVSALEKVGLFDENYFMYLEDVDLCRRIGGQYKTVFFPLNVHIVHDYEKASYKSFKLLFAHIRSAISYFNKWGWLIDQERKRINRAALAENGYFKLKNRLIVSEKVGRGN